MTAAGPWAGVQGDILIVSLPSISTTNEGFTDSGDHTIYNVTNAAHRYFDRSAPPVIQTSPDGTTWTTQASTLYTFRYLTAQVVWNSAQPAGTQVRASTGKYFVYASIGNTTDWQALPTVKFQDVTTHKGPGGSTWADYLPLLRTGTITLKKWFIDATLAGHLSAGDLLIVSCVMPDSTRVEGYCYVKDSNIHAAASGVSEDAVTFQVDGMMVFV